MTLSPHSPCPPTVPPFPLGEVPGKTQSQERSSHPVTMENGPKGPRSGRAPRALALRLNKPLPGLLWGYPLNGPTVPASGS